MEKNINKICFSSESPSKCFDLFLSEKFDFAISILLGSEGKKRLYMVILAVLQANVTIFIWKIIWCVRERVLAVSITTESVFGIYVWFSVIRSSWLMKNLTFYYLVRLSHCLIRFEYTIQGIKTYSIIIRQTIRSFSKRPWIFFKNKIHLNTSSLHCDCHSTYSKEQRFELNWFRIKEVPEWRERDEAPKRTLKKKKRYFSLDLNTERKLHMFRSVHDIMQLLLFFLLLEIYDEQTHEKYERISRYK